MSSSEIADARPGRLAYLRSRLLRPLPVLAPPVAFALMVAGGARVSSAVVVAAVVVVGIVAMALWNARRDARRDFFTSYTRSRGLELDQDRELADVVALLRLGERRYAEQVMTGVLPGGVRGLLALYTYESDRGGEDVRRTQIHRFTVVMHWLPDVGARVSELYCVPRRGASWSGIDGTTRRNRLRLESVALDERYGIFHGPGEDPNWLRRLFSPSFIVWLYEQDGPDFGFQLANGHLCVFVAGHVEDAASLDALCHSAAFVGTRLAEEAAGDSVDRGS